MKKSLKKILKNVFLFFFGKTWKDTYVPKLKVSELKNDDLPWVSFIIPARNESKSIEKCIKAIVYDNYPKTEVVVIDDVSTDDTPDIVMKLKEKFKDKVEIKLIRNVNRLGPSPNRNKGFKVSRGEILIMYDAHSIIVSKNFIKTYVTYFFDEAVGAVAGFRSWKPKIYQDKVLYYAGGVRPWREMGFQFLDNPNAAFRRSVFKEMGMINKRLVWGSDLSNTFNILSLGYKIPVAKNAEVTIDHSVTPNRKTDFIRKNFLYGTITTYILVKYFKWYWKRRVDLAILLGGFCNLITIIIFLFDFAFWWLPVLSIIIFRAHSLAFAVYNKAPIKYLVGIPFILTVSDISFAVGFIVGGIRNLLGMKSFSYRKRVKR